MSLLKKFFLPVNHDSIEAEATAEKRAKSVKTKAKISHNRFCDVLSELNQILEKKDPKEANE
jgi:hypothetical protein|tara:strand:+ start:74 stop:259 length:186 start_codon:yes stop_codon:yes gene_type:complete